MSSKNIFHLFFKRIAPIFKIWTGWYFSKPRKFSYKNINIIVFPKVFFPQFTISTKLLIDFIENKPLSEKTLLELGCGTGLISVYAAKKNAKVIASDINQEALKNTLFNAEKNKVSIQVIESDLFEKLGNFQFDYIIINPPYYPKNPKNIAENAWFCGENFEYFERLFFQLKDLYYNSEVYMILSENCKIEKIKEISFRQNFKMDKVFEKKVNGENNFIFQILSVTV